MSFVETPRDLYECLAWRLLERGWLVPIEEELKWNGPTKEPFLKAWGDGWRKFAVVLRWGTGAVTSLHYWKRGDERKWIKVTSKERRFQK